jgi:hypothetical protein
MKYDVDGPQGLPVDERGIYLPCPLCNRIYCDHSPEERPDSRMNQEKRKSPIELNEFGKAIWRHKENKNLFVERSYSWCDRVVVIDEKEGRRIIEDVQFSTFDFMDWIPVTVEEFQKVKQKLKEIYDN